VGPGLAGEPDPGLSPETIRAITEQFRRHGVADAPAKPAGAVRLATYNIHDLYDEADDPDLSERNEDSGRTMIETRRAATGAALRVVDADIVALQEVESAEALGWYRAGVLDGMGYDYAASEDVGHPLGMEQAVLSRFPILATRTWRDREIGVHPPMYRGRPNRYAGQAMTFRRSPLMVEIGLVDDADDAEKADGADLGAIPEAQRLTLLVVHAKTGDGSDAWRAAEGAALAGIVEELRQSRPGRRVVVLGDFAVPAGEGHLAPLLDAGFADAFGDGPAGGAMDGPAGGPEAATDIDGARNCFVLLGDGVARSAGSSAFVLGTVAPPERLDRRMAYRMPGFASDHYPVVVDLAR
jgi:endonuclease/exonuclease/phosphatase family metal-dependent hydrolase